METGMQNVEVGTRCSGAIAAVWARVTVVGASVADARVRQDTGLTVVSQQLSEGLTPPSVSPCSLAGHGALSHLADLSSELYLKHKQEEIDREEASTEQ